MKKIIYTILVFIVCLSFNLNVNACSGTDGCTNCGNSNATIACQQSKGYKCYSQCSHVAEGSKADCMNGCMGGGSSTKPKEDVSGDTSGGGLPSAGAGTVLDGGGNNAVSSGAANEIHNVDQTVTGADENEDDLECKYLFGDDTATGKYMRDIYNIIKFLVPILLLGLSIKDYATAIINQNQDGVKKATKSFIKRLIVAVIILVMPTIINFILEDLLEIEQCI